MPRSGPTISHAYLGYGSSHFLPRLCRPSSMTHGFSRLDRGGRADSSSPRRSALLSAFRMAGMHLGQARTFFSDK